jgi:hypothetical protein
MDAARSSENVGKFLKTLHTCNPKDTNVCIKSFWHRMFLTQTTLALDAERTVIKEKVKYVTFRTTSRDSYFQFTFLSHVHLNFILSSHVT